MFPLVSQSGASKGMVAVTFKVFFVLSSFYLGRVSTNFPIKNYSCFYLSNLRFAQKLSKWCSCGTLLKPRSSSVVKISWIAWNWCIDISECSHTSDLYSFFRELYYKMKAQWSTVTEEQESRFSEFAHKKHLTGTWSVYVS